MNFTFPTFPATHKSAFVAGWSKYVKPNFLGQPGPADFYWDPRKGGWYLYPSTVNDVQDKGWPKTDISGILVVPETVYDHISEQYMALPGGEQQFACWDPRRAQWMSVRSRGAGGGSNQKDQALNELLAQVDKAHSQGYLSYGSYQTIRTAITNEL